MAKLWFQFRLALYSITLLSVSFVAVLIAAVCTIFGRSVDTKYYVARLFYYTAGPIMGWKFEVEGEEHLWKLTDEAGEGVAGEVGGKTRRSAVMVGNHQSFVDILYLGRIFPKEAAIMAKKSISYIPGLGWFMLLSGTVFINRSNNRSAVASMQTAGEDMKRKKISLWIFPEGTRHLSASPDLLSFKKGAFYLAVQAGAPVVPVVCQNYHHLFDGKTRFKSGKLKIKVLPPIPTTGMTTADVPALMEKTRNQMLVALRTISSSPDGDTEPLLSGASSNGYDSTAQNPESAAQVEREVGQDEVADAGDSAEPTQANGAKASSNGLRSTASRRGKAGLCIAMVSDFFHPVAGGVEGHIYYLGVELMRRGHKVIVITHHHPPRTAVRHLAPGLKVYHLPYNPLASQATLPNFMLSLPYLRAILHREHVDVVHGHGSLSSLAHEALLHAPLFARDAVWPWSSENAGRRIRTVFTDHSLFGFGDAVGVLTNKLLAGALRNVDGVICVSNTGRENTVLRAQLDPSIVSVIPNAILAEQFRPSDPPPNPTSASDITIITLSRLVHRKGIDLLVASAPRICAAFPTVRFVVGGDGPKMVELEQMRERFRLQERVELVGAVRPGDVRDVLTRGQIYLNTSLTEAFGISIIEAASAGLFVVSTKVGGVPEILPKDMIEFARADEEDVVRALSHAIRVIQAGTHDPLLAHERVKGMYSWADVAERTEAVYHRALQEPWKDVGERLSRLLSLGPIFGPIMCIIIAVQHYFFWFLEWWAPVDELDMVEDDWTHASFEKAIRRERPEAIRP